MCTCNNATAAGQAAERRMGGDKSSLPRGRRGPGLLTEYLTLTRAG